MGLGEAEPGSSRWGGALDPLCSDPAGGGPSDVILTRSGRPSPARSKTQELEPSCTQLSSYKTDAGAKLGSVTI